MSKEFRIMAVEDNPADVLLLKEVLAHLAVPYDLKHYDNGEDAAKAITAMTICPDLILLDINIPRIDGLELLGLIRRRETTARCLVAILTSSRAPSDRSEAEKLGADDYIVKPTGYFEFLNTVGPALQRLLNPAAEAAYRHRAMGAQCRRRRTRLTRLHFEDLPQARHFSGRKMPVFARF